MSTSRIIALITIVLTMAFIAGVGLWLYNMYHYDTPWAFWFLLAIPILGVHYFILSEKNQGTVNTSDLGVLDDTGESVIAYARHSLFSFRALAIAAVVFALARPQSEESFENLQKEGIDIVLAMDVSVSMLSKDFKPDRLSSSKKVAAEFVSDRTDDRIGLVVYEGESFTQVPLTSDHRVVLTGLADLEPGLIEGGTAIGMGLATAVNRLRNSEATSKVIILLTDGVNNMGQIDPLDAAKIAEAFGVRVYTIGVGTQGTALSPTGVYANGKYRFEWREVKIDEEILKKIAKTTGGEYFRATSEENLVGIYQQIDQLEKTKFNVLRYENKTEEFFWFILAGITLLFCEFIFRNTLFSTTP
jgi:Ca-activated chloride channel family protein